MRKLCAGILVLTLTACASTGGPTPSGQEVAVTEECTRLEAAARMYASMPVEIQKRAIEDCKRGDFRACVATPVAFPLAVVFGILTAPVLFPIMMLAPYTQRSACPQQVSTTSPTSAGVRGLVIGRLRNRSALVLTDVSIKVSFYDDEGKVGEAWVGGTADRLQGKTTGEKGISNMRVLPGERREFAVRLNAQVPAHYTRLEFTAFNAWGTPPDEEMRAMFLSPDLVELIDVKVVHPEVPQDLPSGTSAQVPGPPKGDPAGSSTSPEDR